MPHHTAQILPDQTRSLLVTPENTTIYLTSPNQISALLIPHITTQDTSADQTLPYLIPHCTTAYHVTPHQTRPYLIISHEIRPDHTKVGHTSSFHNTLYHITQDHASFQAIALYRTLHKTRQDIPHHFKIHHTTLQLTRPYQITAHQTRPDHRLFLAHHSTSHPTRL